MENQVSRSLLDRGTFFDINLSLKFLTVTVDLRSLLISRMRKGGLSKLRNCTINMDPQDSTSPHLHCCFPGTDGVSNSDLEFKDKFKHMPINTLTRGDLVYLLPSFR